MQKVIILSFLLLSLAVYNTQAQQCQVLQNLTSSVTNMISGNSEFFFLFDYYQGYNMNFTSPNIYINDQPVKPSANVSVTFMQVEEPQFLNQQTFVTTGKYVKHQFFRGQFMNASNNLYVNDSGNTQFNLRLGLTVAYLTVNASDFLVQQFNRDLVKPVGVQVNLTNSFQGVMNAKTTYQCFDLVYTWNSNLVTLVVDCMTNDTTNPTAPVVTNYLVGIQWYDLTSNPYIILLPQTPFVQVMDTSLRSNSLTFFQSLNGQGFLIQSFYFSGNNSLQNYIQPYLIVNYNIFLVNPSNWLSKQWPLSSANLVPLNNYSIITNVINAGGKLFFYETNSSTVYGLNTNFTNLNLNHYPQGIQLPTNMTALTMKARFDGITLTVSVATKQPAKPVAQLGLIQFDFTNQLPVKSNQITIPIGNFANIVDPVANIPQLDANEAYWMFIANTQHGETFFVVQSLSSQKNYPVVTTQNLTNSAVYSYQGFDMCVFCQAGLVQQLNFNPQTNQSTSSWNFYITKDPYLQINLNLNYTANVSIEVDCTEDTGNPGKQILNFTLYQPNYVQLVPLLPSTQVYPLTTTFPELQTVSLSDYVSGPDLSYTFQALNTTVVSASSSMADMKKMLMAKLKGSSNTSNTTNIYWNPQYNIYDVTLNQVATNYFLNLPGYQNQITVMEKSINQPDQNLFLYIMQNHNRNIFVYSCSNPSVSQLPDCSYQIMNNYDYNNDLAYFELLIDPTQNSYQQSLVFLFPNDYNTSCIINLYWPFSMNMQTINFCQMSNGQPVTIVRVINNQIFVVSPNFITQIQMKNFTTFYYTTQTITAYQLSTLAPLEDIFVSDVNQDVVYITSTGNVSFWNIAQNKFYVNVPVQNPISDYLALQIDYFLYIVQQGQIIQYQMFPNQLDNEPTMIQSFQLYNKNPFFYAQSDQYTDSTSNFVYVYDFQNFIIYIYRVGYNVFNTLYKTIQLEQTQALDYLFAVEGKNGIDQLFLVIQENQQTNLHMLNVYAEPSLVLNSYWNFTQNSNVTQQTYNFTLYITSNQNSTFNEQYNFTFTNTLGNVNYTIAPFTNSNDNNTKLANSLMKNLLSVQDGKSDQVFTFNPEQISSGFITHFTLNCSSQQDCNQTDPTQNVIQLRNTLGFNRTISKVKMFNSVAKSSEHTFAQARNKLIRLGFENNTILDLVQFPFSDPSWTCPLMQNSPDDTYSFSACTNGKQWTLYGVSYISSQPHVFLIQPINVASVSKFYIQNDNLFILDASNNQYNNLYVYQMQWPTANNLQTVTVGINLVQTFPFKNNAYLYQSGSGIVDNDMNMVIMSSMNANPPTYSNVFFIAFADGTIQYIVFDNMGNYQVSTPQLFSQFTNSVNATLAGIRVYNATMIQEALGNYIVLLVFKNSHSYEVGTTINFYYSTLNPFSNQKLLMQYNQYGFYENTNNIQVVTANNGAEGFLIFPAVQPARIIQNFANSQQQNPFALQYLIAYNRKASVNQTQANVYGAHPYNSTVFNQSFVALQFQAPNQITNYTILTTNPETGTLDRLYLSQNVSIVFQNSSFSSKQVQLIASNLYQTQTFTFTTNAKSSGSSKIWIVFVVVGLVLVALLIIGAVKMYSKKKKQDAEKSGDQAQRLLQTNQ